MAREHARILTRVWSDRDWRALPPAEQRLYFLLLSQGNVTQAGVLPLQVRKWAKGSAHTTEDDIRQALSGLVAERFVVVDEDTEEVLIRSFIRNDGVAKIPNVFKAALRAALAVESPTLRHALAGELRRMRRKESNQVADELSPMESPTVPEPIGNLSGTNGEPLKVSNGIPEPQGEGVGEGEGESPSVGGSVGEPPTPKTSADERPTERCSKHATADDPGPCRGCQAARQRAEAWDVERRAERERLAAAIEQAKLDRRLECEHGTPGGRYPHPDTGQSATCARCRHTTERTSA